MAEKTGVDRTTQVDENDPELFNFDYEVQPILEVLPILFRHCLARFLKQAGCSFLKKGKWKKSRKKKSNTKKEGILY